MEDRTRLYLRGRFRDHYRRFPAQLPPAADEREWAYIPWHGGPGTKMIRHNSLLDLGSIDDFLARERPQHVFYSAGRFERPGAATMQSKRWHGADLIFDLDADHLPTVDPTEDDYIEMLAECKRALEKLLDFLIEDFAFEDISIVFSGGRGYHVHVRDVNIQQLERDQRREIVDYVRGIGLNFEDLIQEEVVSGIGRRTPASKRTLDISGGWGRRVHQYILTFLDELLKLDDDTAIERLERLEGIGQRKAEAILRASRENFAAINEGNIDVHPAFFQLVQMLTIQAISDENAPIDEPVTTDTNRLIRLPGSLHGGSGLSVVPIDYTDLGAFDPLVDAIPETFTSHDIAVDISEPVTVDLGGVRRTLDAGPAQVPEYIGIFLMARGSAEKGKE